MDSEIRDGLMEEAKNIERSVAAVMARHKHLASVEAERDALKVKVAALEQSGREDLNYMREERDGLRDLQADMRKERDGARESAAASLGSLARALEERDALKVIEDNLEAQALQDERDMERLQRDLATMTEERDAARAEASE